MAVTVEFPDLDSGLAEYARLVLIVYEEPISHKLMVSTRFLRSSKSQEHILPVLEAAKRSIRNAERGFMAGLVSSGPTDPKVQ